MQELGWKTSCGCAECRPALNYYLLCAWPGEYRRRRQSRFINERVHANIQKDGTFSVVPRMWGGLTTPTNCAPSPTSPTSSRSRPSRSPAASASTCWASRKEDLPGGVGRPQRRRHGLGPGLRQGPAHGEDLRRHRLVPLRHAGFDGARRQARELPVGLVDAGQGQARGLRLPAQLRRGDRARTSASSASSPATTSTSPARPACDDQGHRAARATSRPRKRRSRRSRALTQLYREQGRYLERIYKWAERVGLETIRQRSWTTARAAARCYDRFVISQRSPSERPVGRARRTARTRTSSRRSPTSRLQRGRGMSALDSPWFEVGPLDSIPLRGCRVVRTRRRRSRCSAPRATRCSRSRTAARTRAAR